MNKITLLKNIDKIAGRFLVSCLSKKALPHKAEPGKINSVLIIRPGGIGDAVLLLPAVRSLKTAFPDISIDMLCEKRNAGVFALSDGIRKTWLYDRDLELFKCIRNSYDAVIDTEQWHRLSAVVAHFVKAPVKTGFDTNERRELFTHAVPYSHDDYEVYSFLRLAEPLTGIPPVFDPETPFIFVNEPFPRHLLPDNKKDIIAIFPGATVAERKWGGEKYGLVAKALQDKGYRIVILGSEADRTEAEKIKRTANRSIDLTGRTSLKEAAIILKHCKLLVTADSGLMHIACGVGTPAVSLFGSGIEKKWAPSGKKHIILNKHIACSPCTKFGYTPSCQNNFKCLTLITADEVISSAVLLLT